MGQERHYWQADEADRRRGRSQAAAALGHGGDQDTRG